MNSLWGESGTTVETTPADEEEKNIQLTVRWNASRLRGTRGGDLERGKRAAPRYRVKADSRGVV